MNNSNNGNNPNGIDLAALANAVNQLNNVLQGSSGGPAINALPQNTSAVNTSSLTDEQKKELQNYRDILEITRQIEESSESRIYYEKKLNKINKQLVKNEKNISDLSQNISNLKSEASIKANMGLQSEADKLEEIIKLEEAKLALLEDENKQLIKYKKNIVVALKETKTLSRTWKTVGKDISSVWGGISKVYSLAGQLNLFKFEKSIKTSALSMGLVGSRANELNQSIQTIASSTVDFGFDITKVAELQGAYSDELGRAVIIGEEAGKKIAAMAVSTGLGAEGAGKMAAELDAVGYSVARTGEYIEQVLADASKLGLNAQKVTKNISNNIKLLNKYNFKEGAKGLAKMAESATKMGISLDSVGSMAEKLFDIEGAVEMSAQLQVMGGEWAKLGDPFKLMYMARNDMDALQKSIINATKSTATFNAKTGEFDISSLEMQRLRKIAEATGLNFEELAQSAKNAAKFSKIDSEIGFKVDDPEMKEFIENTAVFDKKKNKFVLKIGTEERLLSSLSEADKAAIKARMDEKANMEQRAKDALSFDEKISNLVTKFQQMLLPVLDGLEKQLAPIMQKVIDTLNSKEFQNGVKKFINGVLSFTGSVIKFVTEHPVWTVGLFGLFEAGKWFLNGMALRQGFNSFGGMMGPGGAAGGGIGGLTGGLARTGKMFGGGVGAGAAAAGIAGIAGFGINALTDATTEKGSGMNIFGKAAGSALQGAALGAMLGPWGAAGGAIIGALYGGISAAMEKEDIVKEKVIQQDDAVIKFNPKDKFMRVDDNTMIAGTNENGNKDLAKALSNEAPSKETLTKVKKDNLDKDNFSGVISDLTKNKKEKTINDGIIKIKDNKSKKPKKENTSAKKSNITLDVTNKEDKKIDDRKDKQYDYSQLENIIKKATTDKSKLDGTGDILNNAIDDIISNSDKKDIKLDTTQLENIIKESRFDNIKLSDINTIINNLLKEPRDNKKDPENNNNTNLDDIVKKINDNKNILPGIGGILNKSIDKLLKEPIDTQKNKEPKEIKSVNDGIVKTNKVDLFREKEESKPTNLDALIKKYAENNDKKIINTVLDKFKNELGEIEINKKEKNKEDLFGTKTFNKVVENEKVNNQKKETKDKLNSKKNIVDGKTLSTDKKSSDKLDDRKENLDIKVKTNIDNNELNNTLSNLSIDKKDNKFDKKDKPETNVIQPNVDLSQINKSIDNLSDNKPNNVPDNKLDNKKELTPLQPNADLSKIDKLFDNKSNNTQDNKIDKKELTPLQPNVDLSQINKSIDELSVSKTKDTNLDNKEKEIQKPLKSDFNNDELNKTFKKLLNNKKENIKEVNEDKDLNVKISNKILENLSKNYSTDNFNLNNKFKNDNNFKEIKPKKDKKEKTIKLNDGIISKKDGFDTLTKNDLFKILESNRNDDMGKTLKNNISGKPKDKKINKQKEKPTENKEYYNILDKQEFNKKEDSNTDKKDKKNIVVEKINNDYKNKDLGKLFSSKLEEKTNSEKIKNKEIDNKPNEIADKALNKKLLDKYFANDGLIKFNEKDKFAKINDGAIVAGTKEGGNKELAKILSSQAPGLKNKETLMNQSNNNYQQSAVQSSVPGKIDIDFGEITFGGKVEVTHGQNMTDELGRKLLQSPNFLRDISKMVHIETKKAINGGKTT